MKTNERVSDITEWVEKTMSKLQSKTTQNFNVAVYSQEEKTEAMKKLKSLGYTVEMENHNNSMKVISK